MEVKRYRGENMQEAMFKVKADLGADAIILHTRKFKKGGFFGFFGRKIVEVIATVEEEKENREYKELQNELNQMKNMMNSLMDELESNQLNGIDYNQFPEVMQKIAKKLLKQGANGYVVNKILKSITEELAPEDLKDKDRMRSLLVAELKGRLNDISPLEISNSNPKVIALVGPTGVGKTTTIAKLAANFNLMDNKDVALITADTYRIAAVDQLKTYSEIIGAPLEVIFNANELKEAIDKFINKDLILIDTAGRSQKNQMHMSELSALLEKVRIDEKYLVLSVTTKFNDIKDIISKFQDINIDKFILTKLDETEAVGTILNIVEEFNIPLSYMTNGQNVPEDIELIDPQKLVDVFLKEQL
jgi:flagellar biosynthesis protein FlhF